MIVLEVQKYLLSGKTVGDLEVEFGITHHSHPTLPLIGLKYHQINSASNKYHPIVRECRGVVLELDTWDLVAKGFDRFFNFGESKDPFNWHDFVVEEKLDGSNILVFNYAGQWITKTCGGFTGTTGPLGKSFNQLFRENFNKFNYLDERFTYIFELCGPENKVVHTYDRPGVYLLGMFDIANGQELERNMVDSHAFWTAITRPNIYPQKSADILLQCLEENSKIDPTFEGFVLRDRQNNRLKMKSKTYLLWHHAKSTSLNLDRVIEIVLKNEHKEFLTQFPEYSTLFGDVATAIERIDVECNVKFLQISQHHSAKDRAAAMIGFPGKAILFSAHKNGILNVRQYLLDHDSYARKMISTYLDWKGSHEF